MSQVNLLPPEILEAHRWRRLTGLVVAGGGVVIGLILLFYLMQVATVGDVRGEIDDQNLTNERLRGEIADLQQFEDLQVRAQAKEELLAAAFAGEASFSGLLMDVSRVIPSDAALNSLNIAIAAPTEEGEDLPTGNFFVGSITAAGEAEGFESLSQLLTRLEQVDGWVNPWMTSITRRDETGTIYTFSSGVDLTINVLTERGRRLPNAG